MHRVPLFWFPARAGFTETAGVPSFGFELEEGFFYGMPAPRDGGAVKVGLHVPGERVVVRVIWFVLTTGARWEDVPPELGCSGGIAHRRFRT